MTDATVVYRGPSVTLTLEDGDRLVIEDGIWRGIAKVMMFPTADEAPPAPPGRAGKRVQVPMARKDIDERRSVILAAVREAKRPLRRDEVQARVISHRTCADLSPTGLHTILRRLVDSKDLFVEDRQDDGLFFGYPGVHSRKA